MSHRHQRTSSSLNTASREAALDTRTSTNTQGFASNFVSNLHHRTTVPGETDISCINTACSLIDAL